MLLASVSQGLGSPYNKISYQPCNKLLIYFPGWGFVANEKEKNKKTKNGHIHKSADKADIHVAPLPGSGGINKRNIAGFFEMEICRFH